MGVHPAAGLNSPQGGTSTAGAGSDSNAVTPSGLSTGGGTEFSGATRPGPIPGGNIPTSIPSSLPHSLRSSLPSSLQPRSSVDSSAVVAPGTGPATGTLHETRAVSPNWWENLKHVFGGDSSSPKSGSRIRTVDESNKNFGTGEGHLGSYPDYDYAYSGAAFESALFGMGIPTARAKQLSGRIYQGGAIVTVDSAERCDKAETILERSGGNVREEFAEGIDLANDSEISGELDRVQLFGQLQRAYPGYISSTGTPTRKAS